MLCGLLPAHGAAPGGDHGVLTGDGADGVLLRLQKGIQAPLVQDLLEQGVLPLLDHQVDVQKVIAQGLGQQDPHRALARTGHPDQNHIFHRASPTFADKFN